MQIAILGAGAAGIQTCLELLKLNVHPSAITLIDPYFDGGSLQRYWGSIYSNTTFQQILDALQDYSQTQKPLQILSQKYSPESRVLLSDIAKVLQSCTKTLLEDVISIHEYCKSLKQQGNQWSLEFDNTTKLYDIVFLCQGGKQKLLDMGKPSIPLEVALNRSRLSNYVQAGDKVAVFGLAHSGTLIIDSLLKFNCQVYGIYKGSTPFLFARDGHYDGIKHESAEIADKLLETKPSHFEIISFSEIPKVIKAVQKSQYIISSIGFECSPIPIETVEGRLSPSHYNPETAQLAKGLYGFGLAYPGETKLNDKIFKDVSIPSFKVQIQKCLPAILRIPLDGAEQNNQ